MVRLFSHEAEPDAASPRRRQLLARWVLGLLGGRLEGWAGQPEGLSWPITWMADGRALVYTGIWGMLRRHGPGMA